jgi:hypothetical protein
VGVAEAQHSAGKIPPAIATEIQLERIRLMNQPDLSKRAAWYGVINLTTHYRFFYTPCHVC